MMNREEARKRTAMLKQLREQHAEGVQATQALLKAQNETRKAVKQAMKDAARTIPEIAEATGLPAHEILWHVTAMKKYDIVREVSLSGYYYTYRLTEGEEK